MSGLVELARFNSRVAADLARLYLEDQRVGAVLFDADTNSILGGTLPTGVRLMVLDEDLQEARSLLRDYQP